MSETMVENKHSFLIPKNTVQEKPIEIHHLSNTLIEVIVEENAQAIIIEYHDAHESSEDTLYNTLTQITLHKNAQLTHYKKYNARENINFTSQLSVKQKEHSQFTSHVVYMSSAQINKCINNIHVFLEEEYAECTLNGITFGKNKQNCEHHTIVEHLNPHCTSNEYYKAILDHNAKSVFHGKVLVAPNAFQSLAAQSNKTLLLSRSAEITTQPELEIFSDDVKCTHGATVGQLDEDALFYLQARGINKKEAQNLLIDAFLSDILKKMPLIQLEPNNDA